MSVSGPSALGTLLVQRLDAVLGTTLAQQTNIASGARPDAVAQANQAQNTDLNPNPSGRDIREAVDQVQRQAGQATRQAIEETKTAAQKGLLARDLPNTSATPSAPTRLGSTARTILNLLMNFPEQPAVIQAQRPLVLPRDAQSGNQGSAGGQAASGTAPGRSPEPTGTSPASAPATNASSPGATGPSSGTPPRTELAAMLARAVSGQPVSAQAFAKALGSSIRDSGLFYESHLSNLAFGKHDLAALKQEPQAQLGLARNDTAQTTTAPAGQPATGTANPTTATPTSTSHASGPAAASNSATNIANNPANQANTGLRTDSLSSTPAASAQVSAGSTLTGLHPDSQVLVRQQLEVLANQALTWRGEAWPGASMNWEIERREPGDDRSNNSLSHWATRLQLQLPNLGSIQVRLNMVGKQLVMHMVAPQSAQLLSESQAELRQHMGAAGLQLSQLSVLAHDTTETPEDDADPEAPGAHHG